MSIKEDENSIMFRKLVLTTLVLALVACGGGGGGGGNAPEALLSLDKSSIDLQSSNRSGFGNPLQSETQVEVQFKGDALVVGAVSGSQSVDWLNVSAPNVTQAGRATVQIAVRESSGRPILPFGNHSTTLRFATANRDGTVLAHRDLAVKLKYLSQLSLGTESTSLLAVSREPKSFSVEKGFASASSTQQWRLKSDSSAVVFEPASGRGETRFEMHLDPKIASHGHTKVKVWIEGGEFDNGHEKTLDVFVDKPRNWLSSRVRVATLLKEETSRFFTEDIYSSIPLVEQQLAVETDRAWLKAEILGNKLKVVVDRTGLSDGIHRGMVKVRSINHQDVVDAELLVTAMANDSLSREQERSIAWSEPYLELQTVDPFRGVLWGLSRRNPGKLQAFDILTGDMVKSVLPPTPILNAGSAGLTPNGESLLFSV